MKKLPILLLMLLCAATLPALGQGPEGQHIKELMPHGFEDPIDFLKRIPFSFEAYLFYFLWLSWLGGALASWVWKWTQGQADGFHHFTLKYVVGQFMWSLVSSAGLITELGFVTDSGEFWGWLSVITYGALTGFGGEVKIKSATAAAPK